MDDELLLKARRQARERGSTLTSIVEDGLRAVLDAPSILVEPYNLELPVVQGDAPPSVDSADRDALYAILDRPD